MKRDMRCNFITSPKLNMSRSSRLEVFCKKDVLQNFSKFTENHLFFSGDRLRPATLLKKRLWHRCFPLNFVKFLRTPFYTEHLRWLLLYVLVKSCKAFTAHAHFKLKVQNYDISLRNKKWKDSVTTH